MSRVTTNAAVCAAVLAGCAGYGPSQLRVGESVSDVERSMGMPTAIYSMPGGAQRIEYARGPFGRETYMVDADAAGNVTGWSQVLTEANFAALPLGIGRDELLRRLGTPAERQRIGWQDRDLWAWRYPTNDCLWFTVSLDRDQRVVDSGYGIDPRCDAGHGRDRQ
ncbi:MAG: hypothetical protein ACM3N6_07550 [Betaproteobacteria bacterium]